MIFLCIFLCIFDLINLQFRFWKFLTYLINLNTSWYNFNLIRFIWFSRRLWVLYNGKLSHGQLWFFILYFGTWTMEVLALKYILLWNGYLFLDEQGIWFRLLKCRLRNKLYWLNRSLLMGLRVGWLCLRFDLYNRFKLFLD